MGFRRRFEFGLAWRTLVLMLAIWLFVHSLSLPDLRAARLVAAFVAFAALASLWLEQQQRIAGAALFKAAGPL